MTARADDNGRLRAVFEARGAIAFDATADHNAGLVTLLARAWPWARIALAPEVALELARRLVVEVAALSRPPRPRRRP
jgi:hypothetical protein